MRLIDTQTAPVVDISQATGMLGYIQRDNARKLIKAFRLESRAARPGESASGKVVYLRREIEQLAWLRKKYGRQIPKRLHPTTESPTP